MKVKLKQLAQSGATESQVPAWQNTAGAWVPTNVSALAKYIYTLLFVKDDSTPYIKKGENQYTVHGTFLFCGTSMTPASKCCAIVSVETGTGYIRVYDYSNAKTICETSFTNSGKEYVDLGTLSNLPASPAIFEVQLKTTDGDYRLYALNMGNM